jgi:hypothetical protein
MARPARHPLRLRFARYAPAHHAGASNCVCSREPRDVRTHFESGHLVADAALLIACLVELLSESAEGARSAQETSLAAINQSHKLRLEVIKLIASIADGARGSLSPQVVTQTINMLLSDDQAGEMRQLARRRSARNSRNRAV